VPVPISCVGAKVIDDLRELQEITATSTGFIVFDYMAADGRIPDEITEYVTSNFNLGLHERTNSYSEVWVYEFRK
jgi:hypothetical protein